MNPSDPLVAAQARLQRAWLGDGLTDLVLALYFLVPGLFYLGVPWFPPKSVARGSFVILMTAVLMAGPWLARWTVVHLRNRLFSSRSGYSIPAGRTLAVKPWSLALALGSLVLLAVLVPRGVPDWGIAAFLAGTGLAGGALFGGMGWRLGLRRYMVLGALFVAGGLTAARTMRDLGSGFASLYVWFAALLLLNGCWGLVVFLRRHPPAAARAQP